MKLLIADDDDYTREGLADSVDWASFGIEDVWQARDGEEAYRIAAARRPDIVLTDIRMPKLNGIEFAERFAEVCPDGKLVFMSGYMDIEYLKSAIRLSAVDYIEKPIRLGELEKAIARTAESIRERRHQSRMMNEKLELERSRLARLLRTFPGGAEEAVRSLCERTGYPAANRLFVCLAVRFGDGRGESDRLEELRSYWERQGASAVGETLEPDTDLLVLAWPKGESGRLSARIDALLRGNSALTIGVGEPGAVLSAIPDSCRTALEALDRSFYRPNERRFEPPVPGSAPAPAMPDLLLDFVSALREDPWRLPSWIGDLCSRLTETEALGRERAAALFGSFAQAMLAEKNGLLIGPDRLYPIGEVEEALRRCKTLNEVRRLMDELMSAYLEEAARTRTYSRLVQDVRDYIAAHCGDPDLDVREIADRFHLSTAHLGMLFKQETGTSIKQYMSDYRLELAKRLIESGHDRMNEIAERCGYASASYFAKVFKASTELTPVEYRKRSVR